MHLRPWIILAFICGFSGTKEQMKINRFKVEHAWKTEVSNLQQITNTPLTREEIFLVEKKLVQNEEYQHLHLKFVQTIQYII
jgi:hypothetical protein